jgi:hypothetical protein
LSDFCGKAALWGFIYSIEGGAPEAFWTKSKKNRRKKIEQEIDTRTHNFFPSPANIRTQQLPGTVPTTSKEERKKKHD